MEKVIILSGECGDDESLVALIRLLMPRCNVKVVTKGTRAVELFGGERALSLERSGDHEQNI
jgi:hypothetical protein